MKIKNCIFLTIVPILLISACKTTKTTTVPFQITDASYYAWFLNENERGTNITIELNSFPENVTFDAIVFHGTKLPVVINKKFDRPTLSAVQTAPSSSLTTEQEPANGPNRLIFKMKGEKRSIEIENFRREKMKYYNKK